MVQRAQREAALECLREGGVLIVTKQTVWRARYSTECAQLRDERAKRSVCVFWVLGWIRTRQRVN